MTLSELSGFDAKRPVHAYLIVSSGLLAAKEYSASLAAALICEKTDASGNACGECPCCKKAANGTHPDIFTLGVGKVSVDDIRELRSNACLTAHEGDRKIYILENIEQFNEASQNALLKILEEPPKGVYFILTAASKSAVLSTVLSRVCVLTPKIRDFEYYLSTARELTDGKNNEITEAVAAYLEAYGGADTATITQESFEKAFTLATEYFSGKNQSVISGFPQGAEKSKGNIALYLKVFMLVARNIIAYKMSEGRAEIHPFTEEFRKMCVRVSVKRALRCYEILEEAYIVFEDYTKDSKNQNSLYAYLSKKL